jgi:DNA polymerase-4
MDAFYAAIEQRDDPRLRGRPVIVGGDPDRRGVVAACSYEARVYGIHSAMPSREAYRCCPEAIFLRPRFAVYRRVSAEIREILRAVTERVEPVSLDEAYLDVSEVSGFGGSATRLAREIKQRIRAATALTASAGVSYNKFLAKIASDVDKPDGLYVITPEQGPAFVERLPIRKFHGIGRATEARMKLLGIRTGADLKGWRLEELEARFGKLGRFYHDIARGIDERPVHDRAVRKSLSAERTFEQDLISTTAMLDHLEALAIEVRDSLAARHLDARTVAVKVRYQDFRLVTRARTLETTLGKEPGLRDLLATLLARTEAAVRPVRLLGVCASNLFDPADPEHQAQLGLF